LSASFMTLWLVAKLIVWGEDRNKATAGMQHALEKYEITGIRNNIPFLRKALGSGIFMSGNYDTHFISKLKEEKHGR